MVYRDVDVDGAIARVMSARCVMEVASGGTAMLADPAGTSLLIHEEGPRGRALGPEALRGSALIVAINTGGRRWNDRGISAGAHC